MMLTYLVYVSNTANRGNQMDEPNYKELYLRERLNSLTIEYNMINMRASVILEELPKIKEQLEEYDENTK